MVSAVCARANRDILLSFYFHGRLCIQFSVFLSLSRKVLQKRLLLRWKPPVVNEKRSAGVHLNVIVCINEVHSDQHIFINDRLLRSFRSVSD